MSFNLIKGKGKLPVPYEVVERHPCPFYGFNGMSDFLADQAGNQCAIITKRHSPCMMETAGDTPNWNLCPIRQGSSDEDMKRLESFAEGTKVFPREFRPPKAKNWEGIPLKNWMSYVLNKK